MIVMVVAAASTDPAITTAADDSSPLNYRTDSARFTRQVSPSSTSTVNVPVIDGATIQTMTPVQVFILIINLIYSSSIIELYFATAEFYWQNWRFAHFSSFFSRVHPQQQLRIYRVGALRHHQHFEPVHLR